MLLSACFPPVPRIFRVTRRRSKAQSVGLWCARLRGGSQRLLQVDQVYSIEDKLSGRESQLCSSRPLADLRRGVASLDHLVGLGEFRVDLGRSQVG